MRMPGAAIASSVGSGSSERTLEKERVWSGMRAEATSRQVARQQRAGSLPPGLSLHGITSKSSLLTLS